MGSLHVFPGFDTFLSRIWWFAPLLGPSYVQVFVRNGLPPWCLVSLGVLIDCVLFIGQRRCYDVTVDFQHCERVGY
eukprot:gene3535-2486_t